jgi:hypothetical protein
MAGGPGASGRLGCYVLPGGVTDPRPALDQARSAQAQGLGAVWVGERYDTKDLPSLIGALSQVTDRIRLGAAVTHEGLRHPMVLASMAQTLQALSNGRFVLGLGRSTAWRWRAYGARPPTVQSMADTAGILRRLWAGETVRYHGLAGDFPQLRLAQPRLAALQGQSADKMLSRRELTDLSLGLPREWLPSASAAGSDDHCSKLLAEYLDACADELILHGTKAHGLTELTRVVTQPSGDKHDSGRCAVSHR